MEISAAPEGSPSATARSTTVSFMVVSLTTTAELGPASASCSCLGLGERTTHKKSQAAWGLAPPLGFQVSAAWRSISRIHAARKSDCVFGLGNLRTFGGGAFGHSSDRWKERRDVTPSTDMVHDQPLRTYLSRKSTSHRRSAVSTLDRLRVDTCLRAVPAGAAFGIDCRGNEGVRRFVYEESDRDMDFIPGVKQEGGREGVIVVYERY